MNQVASAPAHDWRTMYEKLLLDHERSPRHYEIPLIFSLRGEGFNPLCGDRVTLYMRTTNHHVNLSDRVVSGHFRGESCAICRTSASLLTEVVAGQTMQEIASGTALFTEMLQGKNPVSELPAGFAPLAPLLALKQYPSRHECVLLPWKTLSQLLKDEHVRNRSRAQPEANHGT